MHQILEYLVGGQQGIDKECFWTFVSALATIGLLVGAWIQLNSINKTTRIDFLFRFIEGFFNSESYKLLMLFQYGVIKLEKRETSGVKEFYYFKVDKEVLKGLKLSEDLINEYKNEYSEYSIDQLLGYFEGIGSYERKQLLDIQLIHESFGPYIIIVWQNQEIRKYIKIQRELYGNHIYGGIEYLYNKVVKY